MPRPKAEPDQNAVAAYRSTGYAHPPAGEVVLRRIDAPVTQTPWTFSLAQAAGRSANRPVIVYLPPLGERDDSPCRWIVLWAQAGYAVLVVQALEDDAQIWTTPAARSGDFERAARTRFSDALMSDRVARLAQLLSQVRARGAAGEAALAGLDWSRVALAGADLGAYTVQTLASLPADQLAAIGWPVQPAAFLAISPYARPNQPASAATHGPMLMISSADDIDAYGVVEDVALRHRAFDRLGGDDDYFFELAAATHRWLSGIAPNQPGGAEAGPQRTPSLREPGQPPAQGPRQADPHSPYSPGSDPGSDSLAPVDDTELPPDASAKLAAARAEKEAQLAQARSRLLTQAALSEVGFENISIAFFDAYLRQDGRAHTWLRDSAAGWLQHGDRLKHR